MTEEQHYPSDAEGLRLHMRLNRERAEALQGVGNRLFSRSAELYDLANAQELQLFRLQRPLADHALARSESDRDVYTSPGFTEADRKAACELLGWPFFDPGFNSIELFSQTSRRHLCTLSLNTAHGLRVRIYADGGDALRELRDDYGIKIPANVGA